MKQKVAVRRTNSRSEEVGGVEETEDRRAVPLPHHKVRPGFSQEPATRHARMHGLSKIRARRHYKRRVAVWKLVPIIGKMARMWIRIAGFLHRGRVNECKVVRERVRDWANMVILVGLLPMESHRDTKE
ncbi:hypothetical protein PAAG_08130 [Paracoccidioides lutzii Pb01]|uniref:Uncharacterized protein n=1 Tax=Paracoccidioides lutzii (strain ATCC MYA-826 / Pb01) TaxID=502779 RepID=C1HBI9_PARBA|nr:hypothetical protein PAAG_08130 [Paracoccidioides lutzii Pb01]EEH38403.2 hypothetical protein PAAG_08130 [Paracoccidioides lutzii Pb01]